MHAARSVKIAHMAQAVTPAEPCACFKFMFLLLRCVAVTPCLKDYRYQVLSPDNLAMTGFSCAVACHAMQD